MLDCAPSYGLLLKYEDQHLWGTPGKQHKQIYTPGKQHKQI